MVFDMKTGNVLEYGNVTYFNDSQITQLKGGGGGTQTTTSTSGYNSPEVKQAIRTGQSLYDQGKFGQVAGFDALQDQAQQAGISAAGRQSGLEQRLIDDSNTYDSSLEQQAINDSRSALGMANDTAGTYGVLGGARNRLNQESISNDLTGRLAGIRQAGNQQNYSNLQSALSAQGVGANALAGIGAGRQAQEQKVLDAPATGWQQFVNPVAGLSGKTTTSTSPKGGK